MYPSDYGYSTAGGTTSNRATCLSVALNSWSNATYDDCHNNSWLYNSSNVQWTMTPAPTSSIARYVFLVSSLGGVGNYGAHYAYGIRPTVYLNTDVKIVGGTGAVGDEYQLAL